MTLTLVLCLGVAVSTGCSDSSTEVREPVRTSKSPNADMLSVRLDHDHPCVGAERTSLSAAESRTSVYMPSTESVNEKTLEASWLCATGAPLLQWRSISIHYEEGWSKVDVHANYLHQIEQFDVGRIVQIDGSESLVTPSQGKDFPSEALLVIGDTMCQILGYDVSESELIEIATSLSRSPESAS
jgi:hypothetical protein